MMATTLRSYSFLFILLLQGTTGWASSWKTESDSALEWTPRQLVDNYDDTYFEYALSNFSLRFDRCQYVKSFSDDAAQDKDTDSPLAVKHFAVYRLCPTDACSTCGSGDVVFGRYVTDIEDYLAYTVAEQQKLYEYMCANCEDECNDDDAAAGDCSECAQTCKQLENLEADGYIDAANYIQCQKLEIKNEEEEEEEDAQEEDQDAQDEEEGADEDAEADAEDGNDGRRRRRRKLEEEDVQLYIGPRCSRDGSKILIGLFSDEDCLEPYTDAYPEDYLGGTLSYHYLTHTHGTKGEGCLSCMESKADQNDADEEDADDVNEMCEGLYAQSAKCESKYGLQGFIQENRDEGDYGENQVQNEFMVCDYIDTLLLNTYTETGDINFDAEYIVLYREVTELQKWAVSFLSLSIVALLLAAFLLQRQIEDSIPKVELIAQNEFAQMT